MEVHFEGHSVNKFHLWVWYEENVIRVTAYDEMISDINDTTQLQTTALDGGTFVNFHVVNLMTKEQTNITERLTNKKSEIIYTIASH